MVSHYLTVNLDSHPVDMLKKHLFVINLLGWLTFICILVPRTIFDLNFLIKISFQGCAKFYYTKEITKKYKEKLASIAVKVLEKIITMIKRPHSDAEIVILKLKLFEKEFKYESEKQGENGEKPQILTKTTYSKVIKEDHFE